MLASRLRADPVLGARFARALASTKAAVLGPLAIDTRTPGCAGLLLIGDAAGFVDPMTGDGIRLALASAELATATVADVLAGRLAATAAYRRYARALAAEVGRDRDIGLFRAAEPGLLLDQSGDHAGIRGLLRIDLVERGAGERIGASDKAALGVVEGAPHAGEYTA